MSTSVRPGLFLYWNAKTGPDKYNEAPGTFIPIGSIAPGGITIDPQVEVIEHKGPEAGGAYNKRLYAEASGSSPIITARIEQLTAFEWSLALGDDKVGSTGQVTFQPGVTPSLFGFLRVRGYNYGKSALIDWRIFAMAKSDPLELTNTQFSVATIQFYQIASSYESGTLSGLTAGV